MELYHANRQWATRPEDERFTTLEAMHDATKAYALAAREKEVPWNSLRVQPAENGEIVIVGQAGVPAKLTNYAFGQMAARVKAPAAYLRELPAELAAADLNYGLSQKADGKVARLLFHQNDGLILRAATSDVYGRLWDYEVVERLIDLSARQDLEPAGQTFNWNEENFVADPNAPKALFASDHDLFAFLKSRDRSIADPAGKANLFRGVIVANSEVGDRALTIMGFYFRDVCCNFIIWGATELATIRYAHVGEIARKWQDAQVTVRRYFDAGTSFEEAKFSEVRRTIAATKDEVLDAVFGKRIAGLSRKTIDLAYEAVVPEQDGDPRSKWGLAQGITRHARTIPYADARNEIDRAAGKVLEANF